MKGQFRIQGGKALVQSIAGGILASVGLELFLHPHELIAGGIIGISALVSFQTEKQFGILLLLLHLPLLMIYTFAGDRSVLLKVLPGLLSFAGSAFLLAPLPAVSGEPVIAAMAGGLCLGIGAGLARKSGGLLHSFGLEGNQSRKSNLQKLLSAGMLLCHGAVLVYAGWAMGWERSLYSALACLAAYETATLMIYGIRRTVIIRTSNPVQMQDQIRRRLCLNAVSCELNSTFKPGNSGFLSYTIHVLDYPRFKGIIHQVDPEAELLLLNSLRKKSSMQ